MSSKELTQEYLKSILHYDPETGIFTWKVRSANCIHIGDVAGNLQPNGYIYIQIDGKKYSAHGLAYLYMHGYIPYEIDHWSGEKSNNRIANLLDVTHAENNWKRNTPNTNTSGFRGVNFHKSKKKWRAQITKDGKTRHLGYFDTAVAAASVRNKAADELHGIFARY